MSCYFEERIITSPGLSLERREYTYASDGEGTARCVGMMAGQAVTGPGWFLDSGTAEGSCVQGAGYSHLTGAIPVEGGEVVLDGFLHLQRVGTTGELHGFINGGFYVGTYAAVPSVGGSSCLSPRPTSAATVYGDAVLVVESEAITPPRPHSVVTKAMGDRVTVSWRGSDEPGRPQIVGYNIYRNSKWLTRVDAHVHTVVDDGLTNGTYTYRVEAISDIYESDHGGPATAVVRYSGP